MPPRVVGDDCLEVEVYKDAMLQQHELQTASVRKVNGYSSMTSVWLYVPYL